MVRKKKEDTEIVEATPVDAVPVEPTADTSKSSTYVEPIGEVLHGEGKSHAETVGKVQAGSVKDILQQAKDRMNKQPEEGKAYTPAPDPHYYHSISLTDQKDGPKIKLGRSNRQGKMFIKLTEKPEGEIADFISETMRQNNFHWNSDEQARTKEFDKNEPWRVVQDTEKLFKELANVIREVNGLPPVQSSAVAV